MRTNIARLLVITGAVSACDAAPLAPPALGESAIRGWVVDTKQRPIHGVQITSPIGATSTDAQGRFELTGTPGEEMVIMFAKDGYVTRSDRTQLVAGQITARHAVLQPSGAPALLDAAVGGKVTGARGATMTAPPNAFVDAGGAPITGEVEVRLTPIDASLPDEAMCVGGAMLGRDAAGGRVVIESFGMLDISVRQGGAPLRVAPGKQLVIQAPIPALAAEPSGAVGLWSYDAASAEWIEEGAMTLDDAAATYRGAIGHLSVWNADVAVERSCVCGRVVDESGAAVAGVLMSLAGVDYLGVVADLSEAPDGRFCAVVKRDSLVSVAPYPFALGGVARSVSTGAVDTEIPPDDGGAACVDVGDWVIDKDAYFPAGSPIGATACDFAGSPLAGTCVEPLAQLDACWDPQGTCTAQISGDGFTMVYENGASLVSTSLGSSGLGGTYVAPDGTICGTFEISTGGALTLRLPSGESWVLSQDPATGDMRYTCASGEIVVISAAEGAALSACYKTDTQACTFTGDGGLGSPCSADPECASGLVCCDFGQGVRACLDKPSCDAVNPG